MLGLRVYRTLRVTNSLLKSASRGSQRSGLTTFSFVSPLQSNRASLFAPRNVIVRCASTSEKKPTRPKAKRGGPKASATKSKTKTKTKKVAAKKKPIRKPLKKKKKPVVKKPEPKLYTIPKRNAGNFDFWYANLGRKVYASAEEAARKKEEFDNLPQEEQERIRKDFADVDAKRRAEYQQWKENLSGDALAQYKRDQRRAKREKKKKFKASPLGSIKRYKPTAFAYYLDAKKDEPLPPIPDDFHPGEANKGMIWKVVHRSHEWRGMSDGDKAEYVALFRAGREEWLKKRAEVLHELNQQEQK